MRPPIDGSSIELLRRRLPEFEERFADLLDLYGEDLTAEIVFVGLADYVSDLVRTDPGGPELEACLAFLEESAEPTDGRYLVALPFVSSLSQATIELLRPSLGPAVSALLEDVESGEQEGRSGV